MARSKNQPVLSKPAPLPGLERLLKSVFGNEETPPAGAFSLANVDPYATGNKPNALFLGGNFSYLQTVPKSGFGLGRGQVVSSGTFRNSFYPEILRRHSGVRNVEIAVTFSGLLAIKVYKAAPDAAVECLTEQVLASSGRTTAQVPVGRLDDFGPGVRLFWDIEAIKEAKVEAVAFVSPEPPSRLANLVVTLRTFGRSLDVVDLLRRLSAQAYLPEHFRMLRHVVFAFLDTSTDAETIHAAEPLPSGLNVFAYAGPNLGGGGNAAQLMLDVKAAVAAAGVTVDTLVVLDDDLDISIESLYRYWAYACYQKGDVIVTLPILMKSDPVDIWEDGGLWGRFAHDSALGDRVVPYPRLLRHRERIDCVERLDAFSRINYPEYGTFIFFAIPWKVFEAVGLPAAFFLRGDDVEYSLRAGKLGHRLVSNPNLAAWHEPAHSYGQEYMALLHGLMINFAYGRPEAHWTVEVLLDRFRHHAAFLDVNGVELYAWVLETLVARADVLEPGFEAHYLAKLKACKALDAGFEPLDETAIGAFMTSKADNRDNVSANYVHGEVQGGLVPRLGGVALRNYQNGTVKLYRAFDLEHQLAFAAAAERFMALIGAFAADFEAIAAHWRDKLAASTTDAFWATVRAAAPVGAELAAPMTAPAPPAIDDVLPDEATSGALDEDDEAGEAGGDGETAAEDEDGTLPDGFDGDVYLYLNKDVRDACMDPVFHYLNHGRREGRLWKL